MIRNRYSFDRLKARCGGRIEDVIERLNLANNNALYRLKQPTKYGFPDAVFDRRSDLADRIAEAAEVSTSEVVHHYIEIWKDFSEERTSRSAR